MSALARLMRGARHAACRDIPAAMAEGAGCGNDHPAWSDVVL
jgi:hypothetical protein